MGGAVKYHAAEVQIGPVAELDIFAVVAIEWRLDPDLLAAMAEQLAQQRLAPFLIVLTRRVVAGRQVARSGAATYQV
ncbi:MAG: hypothetical protein L6Q92_07730 [Phycisphaerae bacterium]|nr:hypothetical protein [Phycisphaerae bacterium]